MEEQDVYKYESIDAEGEIRVLHLEPGAFAEPLIGSLMVQKLEATYWDKDDEVNETNEENEEDDEENDKDEDEDDDDDEEEPPAYSCVSYAWGPQQHFTSFICDGKSLRITLVVDEMLRYLRKPKKARRLWIDASMCRYMLLYMNGTN
jgi:hypothetical protein